MTELFEPYKTYKGETHFDTIVIGSGMGGLATASILAKEGERVLILERHYTPGGFTHVFKRNDYEWDVGIHYIGDLYRLDDGKKRTLHHLFDYVCDTPVQWEDMGDVYDVCVIGNEQFEFRKGKEKFLEYFSAKFPNEAEGLKKYVLLLDDAARAAFYFFGEKTVSPFFAALFGNWMRKSLLKYSSQTTQQVLDSIINDEKLKAILCTQFGDYGLPPGRSSFFIHAMVARHYMNGGYYPVGGASVFFEKIAPVINRKGGKILVRAEVAEIFVKDNHAKGVKMSDGKTFTANAVVSDAGAENTYRKLVPEHLRKQLHLEKKLDGTHASVGYFGLYVGFKENAAALKLPKYNYWVFPERYNHDANIDDYMSGKTDEFPVVYISFPSAKDPHFEKKYPNRSTVQIITVADFSKFKKWEDTRWRKRGGDYDALKEEISQQLLSYLYRYVPQTKGKVDFHELSTPLSVQHFSNYAQGELYGLDHTPSRFSNRNLKPRTPIKNLFLTGQDVVTCGLGGALMSGVITASAMNGKNYMKNIVKEQKEKEK